MVADLTPHPSPYVEDASLPEDREWDQSLSGSSPSSISLGGSTLGQEEERNQSISMEAEHASQSGHY